MQHKASATKRGCGGVASHVTSFRDDDSMDTPSNQSLPGLGLTSRGSKTLTDNAKVSNLKEGVAHEWIDWRAFVNTAMNLQIY